MQVARPRSRLALTATFSEKLPVTEGLGVWMCVLMYWGRLTKIDTALYSKMKNNISSDG